MPLFPYGQMWGVLNQIFTFVSSHPPLITFLLKRRKKLRSEIICANKSEISKFLFYNQNVVQTKENLEGTCVTASPVFRNSVIQSQ